MNHISSIKNNRHYVYAYVLSVVLVGSLYTVIIKW